jgi:hypothetical protein
MKNRYLLLIILSLALFGCKDAGKTESAKETPEYKIIKKVDIQMEVPTGMVEKDNLNEFAILQYADKEKRRYLIVLSDEKSMLTDMMSAGDSTETSVPDINMYTSMIADMMNPTGFEVLDSLDVNGHKALMATFSGETEGKQVQYRLGIIEGPDAFYQIMFWTPEDKRSGFDEFSTRVLKSFDID